MQIPTDNVIVSKIVQCKKSGRVFYGGNNGHVYEVKVEDTSPFDFKAFISGEKKKLKHKDLQADSIINKLLPSFLKFTQNKSIVDIKIDEQRNVLYSQCTSLEPSTNDQTFIDVFDLGILSNQFRKITTIR